MVMKILITIAKMLKFHYSRGYGACALSHANDEATEHRWKGM